MRRGDPWKVCHTRMGGLGCWLHKAVIGMLTMCANSMWWETFGFLTPTLLYRTSLLEQNTDLLKFGKNRSILKWWKWIQWFHVKPADLKSEMGKKERAAQKSWFAKKEQTNHGSQRIILRFRSINRTAQTEEDGKIACKIEHTTFVRKVT